MDLSTPNHFLRPISRLIGEPLAGHTTEQAVSASLVVDPKCNPVAVAEIELGHIAMQVALRGVLIDAFHAALEDREKTFDGVGVNGRIGW